MADGTSSSSVATPLHIPTSSSHPVERLDADILSHIFLFGLHTVDRSHFPVIVSHVCSSWRRLVLDTALLWTYIVFEARPSAEHIRPDILFDKPAEWLRRSKEALLDIEVRDVWLAFNESNGEPRIKDAEDSEDIDEHEEMKKNIKSLQESVRAVVRLIHPHSHRWRTLDLLKARESQQWDILDALQRAEAPQLVALRAGGRHAHWPWTFRGFQCLGLKLEELRLEGVSTVTVQQSLFNAAPCLRHLEVSRITFDEDDAAAAQEICSVLKHSPLLETLVINGRPRTLFQWTPPADASPIVAQNLTKLQIKSWNLLAALLSRVHLPNLLHFDEDTRAEILPIIQTYDPFPNLRSLTIDNDTYALPHRVDLSILPSCVSHLTHLERLDIGSGDVWSPQDWIKQLATTCPNLTTLHFEWGLRLTEESIQEMVEGRRANSGMVKPLKDVRIVQVNDCDDDTSKPSDAWLEWMAAHVETFEFHSSSAEWDLFS